MRFMCQTPSGQNFECINLRRTMRKNEELESKCVALGAALDIERKANECMKEELDAAREWLNETDVQREVTYLRERVKTLQSRIKEFMDKGANGPL